jgi:hypothetical protein
VDVVCPAINIFGLTRSRALPVAVLLHFTSPLRFLNHPFISAAGAGKPDNQVRLRLFVDDGQRVLDGLRRMLYPMHNEWEMGICQPRYSRFGGPVQKPFDILVTDLKMPGISGADLLEEAVAKYPGVVRMVLSGALDPTWCVTSAGGR